MAKRKTAASDSKQDNGAKKPKTPKRLKKLVTTEKPERITSILDSMTEDEKGQFGEAYLKLVLEDRYGTDNETPSGQDPTKDAVSIQGAQNCGNCKHWANEMAGWADCEVHDLNQPASHHCSDWLSLTTPNSQEPATDDVSVKCATNTTKTKEPQDEIEDQDTTANGKMEERSIMDDGEATTQTDSSVDKDDAGDSGTTRSITQLDSDTNQGITGDVSLSVAVAESPIAYEKLTREESQAAATRRWRSTGIAEQVAVFRDRVREEYRAANPGCKRRDAHEHAWDRAMAKFPPPGVEPVDPVAAEDPAPENSPIGENLEVAPAPIASDQGVPGLGTMPDSWGTLPANASLQVEISWVSANRLRVRDGSGVDLSKALSPAPSYSALSWLETSILFPSKFADISVKATANQDDEREAIRREKLSIEEIRGLLAEMLEG